MGEAPRLCGCDLSHSDERRRAWIVALACGRSARRAAHSVADDRRGQAATGPATRLPRLRSAGVVQVDPWAVVRVVDKHDQADHPLGWALGGTWADLLC